MSSLSRADVQRIAALAKLALTDDEIDLFARQLTGILDHAESIQQVDTTGVPPFRSVVDAGALRADEPVAGLSREDALANAPQADADSGTFVVPKVIG